MDMTVSLEAAGASDGKKAPIDLFSGTVILSLSVSLSVKAPVRKPCKDDAAVWTYQAVVR